MAKKDNKKKDNKKKKKDKGKKVTTTEKLKVNSRGKIVLDGTTSLSTYLDMMNNLRTETVTGDSIQNIGMRLFGLPYQFTDAVDPRYTTLNKNVGHNFTENFLLEAPVCTFIPGKPKYIPGEKSAAGKTNMSTALIGAASGNLAPLQRLLVDNDAQYLRLYDFQTDWTNYMNYVNILCRAGASFLGINEKTYIGSKEYDYEHYDWRNYRWNDNATTAAVTKFYNLLKDKDEKNKAKADNTTNGEIDYSGDPVDLDEVTKDYQYIQFYIDPEGSSGDSVSNSTTQSQFKGVIDNSSQTMKEMSFLLNAGGIDSTAAQQFLGDSSKNIMGALTNAIGGEGIVGKASQLLGRLTNLTGDVIKGNNIIIPDIYDSSSYSKEGLSVTVHLKSPYGTKLAYYLNIFVPMMHLLALAVPRQATANSYQGPFLVKAFVEGMFSVNLGVISAISISKVADSRSVDGLPMEVDVTLQIQDLYSDLMMSNSEEPLMFINNSSLVEFLATNCGLSLTNPNYQARFNMIVNSIENKLTDIPNTVKSTVNEYLNSQIARFTHLTH